MTYCVSYFFYNNYGDIMKIYIDLVLLINFGFDLLLLFSVAIILRRKTNIKRIVIASLFGSITIISMFIEISSFCLLILKIFISILMVIITFNYKNINYTLKNLFYLYISSVVLGGFLYLININFSYKHTGLVFYYNGLSINFILMIILSPIIIWFYVKQGLLLKNNYNYYYSINIYLRGGEIIDTTAFLDTGNKLLDPYRRRPIILLNKELLKFNYDNNIILVPYDSLNNHGLLKCLIPDKIFIKGIGVRYNFLVGIANEKIKMDGIDCIISSSLIERN